jgi:hypothetical protein
VGGRAPPGAVTRPRSGAQRVSPVARMSGRRPGRSLPCPPRPVRRGDLRPTGRADVRCPGVRCPGVWTDRPAVSAALPPGCPRRAGPGVARCGGPPPVGRSGSRCRRGRRAAWSPACIGPDGKGRVRRWPWLAGTRVDRSPGPPLGRRPGCGAVLAPAGRHGRWSRARVPAGCGGEHGTEQVLTGPAGRRGRSRRRGAGHGPGPAAGDHAGWSLGEGGPVASSCGGSTRFGGEQPAAAARPRHVRSAVRQALTGS